MRRRDRLTSCTADGVDARRDSKGVKIFFDEKCCSRWRHTEAKNIVAQFQSFPYTFALRLGTSANKVSRRCACCSKCECWRDELGCFSMRANSISASSERSIRIDAEDIPARRVDHENTNEKAKTTSRYAVSDLGSVLSVSSIVDVRRTRCTQNFAPCRSEGD